MSAFLQEAQRRAGVAARAKPAPVKQLKAGPHLTQVLDARPTSAPANNPDLVTGANGNAPTGTDYAERLIKQYGARLAREGDRLFVDKRPAEARLRKELRELNAKGNRVDGRLVDDTVKALLDLLPGAPLEEMQKLIMPSKLEPPEYLIDSILMKGTTCLFWGLPSAGKTWTAYDWLRAVALKQLWLGKYAVHAGPEPRVLLIDCESDKSKRDNRFAKVGFKLGREYPNVRLFTSKGRALNDEELWEYLEREGPFDLIVVDSLSRGMTTINIDQNSDPRMADPLVFAKQLCRQSGDKTVVVFIHHAVNDGSKQRGSGAIYAAAEGIFEAERTSPEDGPLKTKLVCTRQKEGKPFDEVHYELTDNGLSIIETPAGEDGKKLPLKERVRRAISSQWLTKSAIALLLGVKSTELTAPLNELKDEGLAREDGKGKYQEDSHALRFERVLDTIDKGWREGILVRIQEFGAGPTARDIQQRAKVSKGQLSAFVPSWLDAEGRTYRVKRSVRANSDQFGGVEGEVWQYLVRMYQWEAAPFMQAD